MLRTLYGKLALAFLVVVCLSGLFYVALTIVTTRLHQQEISQNLNQSLAANIVDEYRLLQGREINQAALKDLFHSLMVINPAIEVYLVDPEGRILAYTAPPGKVKRKRISITPIDAFLADARRHPVRGDDPRALDRTKVFSAAPIYDEDRLSGYLYVVLGGEEYDSVAEMFEGSYILRLSAGIAAASLVLVLLVGFLSFNWLTRRLRRLMASVDAFHESDFQETMALPRWNRGAGGDEIDKLGVAFEEASRRIVDQIRQLRDADSSRRDMIANISHDLRTPLASLQGYLETVLIKHNSMTPDQQKVCVELAHKHGERLSRLVTELFELAVLDAPDAPRHFEAFSLGELVQDVAQKLRLSAENKGLCLEVEIPENPPFVSGDIGLIERTLDNLIENAVKYTPAGGTVRLALTTDGDHVMTRVSDTGPGIPADELPHIFERFYRVERSRGSEIDGSGLGLAIAFRILELHDSTLEVESVVGRGTTFGFRLAILQPAAADNA